MPVTDIGAHQAKSDHSASGRNTTAVLNSAEECMISRCTWSPRKPSSIPPTQVHNALNSYIDEAESDSFNASIFLKIHRFLVNHIGDILFHANVLNLMVVHNHGQ